MTVKEDTKNFTASDIRRRTLEAMRTALLDVIIPELSNDGVKTTGHILLRLMDHLLADERGVMAPINAELAGAWKKISGKDESALIDPAGLETVLPEILAKGGPEARKFLEKFTDWTMATLVKRDPEAAGGVAEMYRGGKSSRAEQTEEKKAETPLLTPERLTEYMRRRFPDKKDITVESVVTLPGGFSKQTVLIGTTSGGKAGRFVIRKDLPVSPSVKSVASEYPLLRAVWQHGGIKIAEPHWLETDPAEFGTSLMAVSHAEGSGDYRSWANDPAKVRQFGEDLAKSMARLHSMPLQATVAGPVRDLTPKEHIAAEVERWYSEWQRCKIEPRPILEAVFEWLRANIPAPRAPTAIVHGDIGFHNMLMKDGRLTALLDWEFSHIGDPAEDLVYCRFFVEQVIDWESFLQIYEAAGGKRATPEQQLFYTVWASARNSAGCEGALYAFLSNDGADAKLGVSGMTFLQRFEHDAFEHIVKG